MATADAKLLPPPPFPAAPDSDQNLDSVGPLAVLGAMVNQKNRASRPPAEEVEPVVPFASSEASTAMLTLDDEDDFDADDTHPRRVPQYSDAFLKVR